MTNIAIQFGAGNIGRGFIGVLLAQAGYEVIFVDVVDDVVEAINQHGQYTIKEIIEGQAQATTVENVKAINGKVESEVVEAISQASIITTAVGPNVLRIVAPVIAKGIQRRSELGSDTALNIIACENLIDNSRILQEYVSSHLSDQAQTYADQHVGFPRCVIDRVVTNPSEAERAENPLLVIAEGQGLWIVDRQGFVGEPPTIAGIKLTDNLDAYVEQKIFTLNTAHAATGYLGYLKGYEFIHQAMEDAEIHQIVSGAAAESSSALIKRHNLDPDQQAQYVADTLQRFANDAVPDPIVRVVREPKRKLAANDRLIKPALLALEVGVNPDNLAMAIAAGLLYDNVEDSQAVEISQTLQKNGIDAVLAEVCDLSGDSQLAQLIKEKISETKKLRKD
ncbi:MAG: mannitol-1-phosphate 5-dehydrogenase [Chloroflexota bacterium]